MTDRELLQQALDALNDALVYLPPNIHAENVALFAVNSLRSRLAQPEQKPVAWAYVNTDGECEQIEFGTPIDDPDFTPLYTAPTQSIQKPLTAHQIRLIRGQFTNNTASNLYVRAIEAAHNIKETK